MKKHLLITAVLLLASCRSNKEILHTADTLHITTLHYDSIFIDRQTLTTYNHDTVYVDRWQTEYRYRTHIDTIYRSYTDTVYTTTTLPPEKPPPTNLKYPIIVLFLLTVLGIWLHQNKRL
ncbi:MAG: hypothetical protein IKW46_06095 [Bacteroidaceae bacterium]|nr:hypothetical protein [Bacteroidaceae bacterium]